MLQEQSNSRTSSLTDYLQTADLGSDCELCLNFIAQAVCYVFILPSKLSFTFMEQYWSPPVAKLIILSNGAEVLPGRSIISFFKKRKKSCNFFACKIYVEFIQVTASHAKSKES